MSFYIINIDNKNREITAIADKRLGKGYRDPAGKIQEWSHVNDDLVKIHKITEFIFFTGMGNCDISDVFLDKLLAAKESKPSQMVALIKGIDRVSHHCNDVLKYDTPVLFGIYDDGEPFFYNGNDDGTDTLKVIKPGGSSMQMSGGKYETASKVAEFAIDMKKGNVDSKTLLLNCMDFASAIDNFISPNHDLLTLKF